MILLTGANGFLGKHIVEEIVLNQKIVKKLGRSIENDIICDLSKDSPNIDNEFECIIHCSGKAHIVPKSALEIQAFFDVNVTGTRNLLMCIDRLPVKPRSFIFISSVAVYGNETGVLINEETALCAKDPYGLSKISAEKMIKEWCEMNNVICTILRLPLLAGLNPPGNLKDMINGINRGYYFNIAGGNARKSMVLAEDVARIILRAALFGGTYNLTDRYNPSFSELSVLIAEQLGKSAPLNMPFWIANLIAKSGDLFSSKIPLNSNKLNKILSDLTFDDTKAYQNLNWRPRCVLDAFKIK